MQIVRAMGGLGNQMFAYAFLLRLRSLGREAYIDRGWYSLVEAHNGWELDRVFGIDEPEPPSEAVARLGDLSRSFPARLRRKVLGPRRAHVEERPRSYDPRFLDITDEAYLEGYWQSPRYHEGVGEAIEASFRFPKELEPETRALIERSPSRTIVGVHVRRGDYLASAALGGVCSREYYLGAIEAASAEADRPLVLFFSDDLDWCRAELAAGRDCAFVQWNRGADSWRDLRLMTLCDRLVISNSSFSWWGSRLGPPGRPVVAPSRWYAEGHEDNPDIALQNWLRLDAKGRP